MIKTNIFTLVPLLSSFVLACFVSGNALAQSAPADEIVGEYAGNAPSSWKRLADTVERTKLPSLEQMVLYNTASGCGVLIEYSSRCEDDGDPCHISTSTIGTYSHSNYCIASWKTNTCLLGPDTNEVRYEIRASKILGAIHSPYRRLLIRAEPLKDQPKGESAVGMTARVSDTFTTIISGAKDPFDVTIMNAIMLCDERQYKQEKANFEKFLMSLRFRGKSIVPSSEKWQPHRDVYCDACPPEKSKQKPTVR